MGGSRLPRHARVALQVLQLEQLPTATVPCVMRRFSPLRSRSASRAAGCVHLLRADLNVSARLSQKRCAGCRARPPTGTKNMAKATSATHAINQGPS